MYFLISNFLSSLIYSIIFLLKINTVPGFELSVGSFILIMTLSFICGGFCTLPLWCIFQFHTRKKYTYTQMNIVSLSATIIIILIGQKLFWKDFSDTRDILFSFVFVSFIFLNISKKRTSKI